MGNKILLVGGSRDGEWVNDPGLPRYHVILQDLPLICKSTYPPTYDPPKVEVYTRRTSYLISGDTLEMYVPENLTNYQALTMLMKHYQPKPPAPVEQPKPAPEDPEVTKRKQEDRLAAAAWNNFVGRKLE